MHIRGMQEISEEEILDNYCTWHSDFSLRQILPFFNMTAITLTSYLWIKTTILMYRALLLIQLYNIKSTTHENKHTGKNSHLKP